MAQCRRRRLVFVGDEGVGKTSAIHGILNKPQPLFHISTIEDRYNLDWIPNVELVDTAGSCAFDRLRPFSYEAATDVVICFAVDSQESYEQVSDKWAAEARFYCPSASVFLLGTKVDLRLETNETISADSGEMLAKQIGALNYFEANATHSLNAILTAILTHNPINQLCVNKKKSIDSDSTDDEMDRQWRQTRTVRDNRRYGMRVETHPESSGGNVSSGSTCSSDSSSDEESVNLKSHIPSFHPSQSIHYRPVSLSKANLVTRDPSTLVNSLESISEDPQDLSQSFARLQTNNRSTPMLHVQTKQLANLRRQKSFVHRPQSYYIPLNDVIAEEDDSHMARVGGADLNRVRSIIRNQQYSNTHCRLDRTRSCHVAPSLPVSSTNTQMFETPEESDADEAILEKEGDASKPVDRAVVVKSKQRKSLLSRIMRSFLKRARRKTPNKQLKRNTTIVTSKHPKDSPKLQRHTSWYGSRLKSTHADAGSPEPSVKPSAATLLVRKPTSESLLVRKPSSPFWTKYI